MVTARRSTSGTREPSAWARAVRPLPASVPTSAETKPAPPPQMSSRRLASTHRVTSPFPGSVHPEIHHIHRPADFPDVYAGIGLDSRPYDAILDVFLALPPVPAELHALRLHLACSGRLAKSGISEGMGRSLFRFPTH